MIAVQKLIQKTKDVEIQGLKALEPKENICSFNTKTGWSLNFPISKTCQPTKICSKVCYGTRLNRPITWNNSLAKNLRLYEYFLKTPTQVIVDRIYKQYVSKKMTFLRWNGVGDLFPKAIEVINRLVTQHEDVVLWVVTKKVKEALALTRNATNLYIMFSLDSDPQSKIKKSQVLEARHPRIYFSFLRTDSREDTLGAQIIFNMQQKKKDLPFEDLLRCCPVDAGKLETKDACQSCRKCFSDKVFER